MAKSRIPEGSVAFNEANKLYLYQVLSEALGCGKQIFLPKAYEAIEAVELTCEGLGYNDPKALFEALSEFATITTFKGGRFYVTISRNEAWDAALAKPTKDKGAGKGAKPWKRKKGSLKPVRPKMRVIVAEEPEVVESADPAEASAAASGNAASAGDQSAKAEAPNATAPAEAPDAPKPQATGDAPAATEADLAAQTVKPAEAEAPEAHAAPEPRATTDPLAGIKAQVSKLAAQAGAEQHNDSSAEDHEPALAAEPAHAAQPALAASPAPASAAMPVLAPEPASATPVAAAPPAPARRDDFPHSFADDVSIKPALLGMLTRILPIDADLMTLLDEDFRVARATGTATGSRARLTFPLRYLQEDGSAPVTLTIRRSAKPGDIRPWQLILVDGDDGTGRAHEAVGLEGLPQATTGFWRALSRHSAGVPETDPVRELAQFMMMGSWDTFLGTIATAAAPEGWNYPGEGVGKASRYGILREYLAATVARVRATDALAVSPDGSFAAFDSGLVSPVSEPLYIALEATGTDIPWRFAGIAEAGTGELGARITATFAELPQGAHYLDTLDDVRPCPEALVIPDYRALLTEGLAYLPKAFLATQLEGTEAEQLLERATTAAPAERTSALRELGRVVSGNPGRYRRICRALDDAIDLSCRAARQSYRHAAAAYDPARNVKLLLLPLALVDDARVDCAVALERMPSGAYQVAHPLTLAHAYSAARVVSKEMPTWLNPATVLA